MECPNREEAENAVWTRRRANQQRRFLAGTGRRSRPAATTGRCTFGMSILASWSALLEGIKPALSLRDSRRTDRRLPRGRVGGLIHLWDVQTGAQLKTLIGHTDGVGCVVYSPDGGTLASGSNDGTARLWDVQTGEQIAVLKRTWKCCGRGRLFAGRTDARQRQLRRNHFTMASE